MTKPYLELMLIAWGEHAYHMRVLNGYPRRSPIENARDGIPAPSPGPRAPYIPVHLWQHSDAYHKLEPIIVTLMARRRLRQQIAAVALKYASATPEQDMCQYLDIDPTELRRLIASGRRAIRRRLRAIDPQ